jgi:hypothetical protein
MRKIEQEMLSAIDQGRNWQKSNTSVTHSASGCVDVHLHGNHIACVTGDSSTGLHVVVNKSTLFHWGTPTTKSRLRAMGVNVYHKNHTLYLDDVPDYKWERN